MIEKFKKHITVSAEDEVLNIEKKDIEQYLSEVKEAVRNDRYRLDRNAKRQDNINHTVSNNQEEKRWPL